MPAGSAAAEVRALLRAALVSRLEPAGWQLLTGADEDLSLAFIRPAGTGFAATARVSLGVSIPDRRPVLVAGVSVGVSFEPLRRLWPLLGDFPVEVVEEHVWSAGPPVPGGEGRDPESVIPPLEVSGAGGAERAARELAPLILERAPAFAERYASLDVLLAEWGGPERERDARGWTGQGWAGQGWTDRDRDAGGWAGQGWTERDTDVRGLDVRRAALLAAAGRFEEARASLEFLRLPAKPIARRQRRAARQLRRWIDSGGDPALIPSSPPPSSHQFPRRERKPLWEALAQGHAEEAKRRSAVEEVKKNSWERGRDEARLMLRRELARRGAGEQSPLWIEDTLDRLQDSPADQMQRRIRTLKGAGRFALAAARAIRDRELPDLSPPDWLEPPDHALYDFPCTEPAVAVDLDRDAERWLERVHGALPSVSGSVPVTAWLKPAQPAAGAPPGLLVFLGDHAIGSLPGEIVPAYRQVVEDAAFRDENPCMQARLTRREWGYLLEIARPA